MGSFELTADGAGVSALVTWTETVLEEENASVLSIDVELRSTAWYGVSYWLTGTVGDDTLDPAVHYAYLGSKGAWYPVEGGPFTQKVIHKSDGDGFATISLNFTGSTRTGGAASGWRITGSRTVELTPIARASTVGATDADIGAVSMIAVSRKNSSYSHSLRYEFGELTGWIGADGSISVEKLLITAAAIPFTVPEEFYGQIPDSPTGLCRVICTTEEEGVQIGEAAEAVFTVTAPKAKCAPVLEAQVADVNGATTALTGDPAILVRFCSTARCTLDAQAQFGASIVSRTPDGDVEGPEQETFVFEAVDSRGYDSSLAVVVPMVPYVLLTANVTCQRTDAVSGQARLTVRGSYYDGSFGAADNSLTLTAAVGGAEYTLTPELSDKSYTATLLLEGLDYTAAHTVTVTAADALATVTASVLVRQGTPVFDWGGEDFAFHVPVTAPSFNGVANPALAAYPVGAVFMTAGTVSPGELLGGNWEKLENMGIELNLWKRLEDEEESDV